MKNFILIEPTNVKIIYARNFLLTLCTAVKLQLKGSTSRLKYSVKNLILNHSQQSQRFFVLCVVRRMNDEICAQAASKDSCYRAYLVD